MCLLLGQRSQLQQAGREEGYYLYSFPTPVIPPVYISRKEQKQVVCELLESSHRGLHRVGLGQRLRRRLARVREELWGIACLHALARPSNPRQHTQASHRGRGFGSAQSWLLKTAKASNSPPSVSFQRLRRRSCRCRERKQQRSGIVVGKAALGEGKYSVVCTDRDDGGGAQVVEVRQALLLPPGARLGASG